MHGPLNVKYVIESHLSKHAVCDIVYCSIYTLRINQHLFAAIQNYIFILSSCIGVLNTYRQLEICY